MKFIRLESDQIEQFTRFICGHALLPPPCSPSYKMSIQWNDNSSNIITAHTCFCYIDVCYKRYLPPFENSIYDDIVMYAIPNVGFQLN